MPVKPFILILLLFTTLIFPHAYAQKRSINLKTDNGTGSTRDLTVFLYEEVDEQPAYPGGEREMMKYINSERSYPQDAYESGIQGRVLCSFIVQANGDVTCVEVIRGVERSLNEEAVRIIEKMPKWSPGKVSGSSVPTYCILPISFRK